MKSSKIKCQISLVSKFSGESNKKSGFENKYTSRFMHDRYLTCNFAVEFNAGILQQDKLIDFCNLTHQKGV